MIDYHSGSGPNSGGRSKERRANDARQRHSCRDLTKTVNKVLPDIRYEYQDRKVIEYKVEVVRKLLRTTIRLRCKSFSIVPLFPSGI